jgi:hypothetical protein
MGHKVARLGDDGDGNVDSLRIVLSGYHDLGRGCGRFLQ